MADVMSVSKANSFGGASFEFLLLLLLAPPIRGGGGGGDGSGGGCDGCRLGMRCLLPWVSGGEADVAMRVVLAGGGCWCEAGVGVRQVWG